MDIDANCCTSCHENPRLSKGSDYAEESYNQSGQSSSPFKKARIDLVKSWPQSYRRGAGAGAGQENENINNSIHNNNNNNSSSSSREGSGRERRRSRRGRRKGGDLGGRVGRCNSVGGDLDNMPYITDFDTSYTSDSKTDLESLPDLTDDDDDNNNLPSSPEVTPTKQKHKFIFLDEPHFKFEFQRKSLYEGLRASQREVEPSTPSIFEIPEIVHRIITYVDAQNTVLPHEATPVRRKPISHNHAMLIYGSKRLAELALKDKEMVESNDRYLNNPLYNCLLVNKLFNKITKQVLLQKFYFDDETRLQKYIMSKLEETKGADNHYHHRHHQQQQQQPRVFNLHKIFRLKQSTFNFLNHQMDFSKLRSFHLFMCPKIQPSWQSFTNASNLTEIVITGNKAVDDTFCYKVSQFCQKLELLDLRACELITDSGLYSIFEKNKNLKVVNVGRKNKGHLITDSSLHILVRNNKRLHTLGLSGSYVTDRVLWEIAALPDLARLSLNNCCQISNQCITSIFTTNTTALRYLSVLELRHNLQLIDLAGLIAYKRAKDYGHEKTGIFFLLELCEELMYRYRIQELEIDRVMSQKIVNDINQFVHGDDTDLSLDQVSRLRRFHE